MKKKYCTFCGRLCKKYEDDAEKYTYSYYPKPYGYQGVRYNAFDSNTGKKNKMIIHECPERKKERCGFFRKKIIIDERHSRFINES